MGRMESKSTIGVKYYDVLSKKTFGDIAALDRRLPLYSFENQGGSRLRETYFDTPGKLLARAGLTLCKVVEGNRKRTKQKRSFFPAISEISISR